MKKLPPRAGATTTTRPQTTSRPAPAPARPAVADRAQRLAQALETRPRGKSPEVKAKIIARLKRLHPMD